MDCKGSSILDVILLCRRTLLIAIRMIPLIGFTRTIHGDGGRGTVGEIRNGVSGIYIYVHGLRYRITNVSPLLTPLLTLVRQSSYRPHTCL